MTYTISDIVRDVRIAMDENMTSDALSDLGDVDTLALNDIIRSKIVEAVAAVHCEAPIYLLEGLVDFSGSEVTWLSEGRGRILLPNDFMRFVMFKMSDWERAVFTAISPEDAEYSKQWSRYKGLRGTPQRPICAITAGVEGRMLEFYSSKDSTATVSKAAYMAYPQIITEEGADDTIAISERCYRSAVYRMSALTMATVGETERVTLLSELSKAALQ